MKSNSKSKDSWSWDPHDIMKAHKTSTPKYMQISLMKKDMVSYSRDQKKSQRKSSNFKSKKISELKPPSTSTRGPNLKISFFSNREDQKKTVWVDSDERKSGKRKIEKRV